MSLTTSLVTTEFSKELIAASSLETLYTYIHSDNYTYRRQYYTLSLQLLCIHT